MTAVATEIELGFLEDLDAVIACQSAGSTCDEPATWLLIKWCGCDLPFCDMHKVEAAAEIASFYHNYAPGHVHQCCMCGSSTSMLIPAAYRWERLP